MAFAFPLFFYKRGVSMMTDYEMLSIVIMIITLVVSLLINNRDKKKQRRHPALTGGRLNSLKGGEKPTTASSLPAVIVSRGIQACQPACPD